MERVREGSCTRKGKDKHRTSAALLSEMFACIREIRCICSSAKLASGNYLNVTPTRCCLRAVERESGAGWISTCIFEVDVNDENILQVACKILGEFLINSTAFFLFNLSLISKTIFLHGINVTLIENKKKKKNKFS